MENMRERALNYSFLKRTCFTNMWGTFFTAAFVVFAFSWYKKQKDNVLKHLDLKDTGFSRILKEKKGLSSFSVPFYLSNGFAQTVFFNYFLPAPNLKFEREIIQFEGGGQASLDWHRFIDPLKSNKESSIICLVFPALGTSCRTKYVRHLVNYFVTQGKMDCCVVNVRGSAGTDITSHHLYDIGCTKDIHEIVRHVQTTHKHSKLVALGASMGSNILVKYLCDTESHQPEKTPLRAAVSISNPFNLYELMSRKMNWPFNLSYFRNLFEDRFVQWFKRRLRKFSHVFYADPGSVGYDLDAWLETDTMEEFTEFAAQRVFKYESFEQYLQVGSCGNYIDTLSTPCLFVNALDDPLVPESLIPHEKLKRNKFANVLYTENGGHIAFLDNRMKCWFMPVAKAFLETILESDEKIAREES